MVQVANIIGSSGGVTRSQAFRWMHPAVAAAYFACVLVLSMAALHPVLCAISLAAALVFGIVCRGGAAVGKSLLWCAPLVVLVAILNPFFSAQGSTELGRLLGYPVYVESLAFGTTMGLLMCSTIVWMQNAAAVISMEDTMGLVGRALPLVGLMMSMIARLIPRYVRRGNMLAQLQSANTCARQNGVARAGQAGRRFGVLMAWSMEDSLVTGDAMLARGWRTDVRRSTYERRTLNRLDVAALCVVLAGALLAAGGAWQVCHGFAFYPVVSALRPHVGMGAYTAYMMLACLFEIGEVLRWRR